MADNIIETKIQCSKSSKCSRQNKHKGSCKKDQQITTTFFQASPIYKKHTMNTNIDLLTTKEARLETTTNEAEANLKGLEESSAYLQDEISEMNTTYNKLKTLLDQKPAARKRRENNPTTFEAIHDSSSTTRYRKRQETGNVLEYIHGGVDGAIYGAWDYVVGAAKAETLEKLTISHKRGKFLQTLYGKFSSKHDEEMRRAISVKYNGHLSRRKYEFICKVQNCTYDPEDGKWSPKFVEYGDCEIKVGKRISNETIKKFTANLDMGEIHQITGYAGAFRTITALVQMIVDLHLRVKSYAEKLIWFNNNENHFVVEFSDDGAPESRESTMSIGTLSLWNFSSRIRSREFHYPLHMVSASEKDKVCEQLWEQHSDEMMLIESNIFTIDNKKITFEFQPSADQAWQFWAGNTLTQSATYPSNYANVHKSELTKVNGSIGFDATSTWKPPTMESRDVEIERVTQYKETLSIKKLDQAQIHKRVLSFMAENGLRQLGTPRIAIFADRLRPEPLHLEVNNWQHLLNLLYIECVRSGKYLEMKAVLQKPATNDGCSLDYIASVIDEHFQDENNRMKKLETRLIGAQAILLAKYSFRIVDVLINNCGNKKSHHYISLLALSKICETLRDIGCLLNRVNVDETYPSELSSLCRIYFNLFSLFFSKECQSTVWTLGYAVPYHANIIYTKYKVGYGILSMQGKESKHSAIKQELKSETNRSKAQDASGKWQQLMRSSFVRNFYLPFHYPIGNYISHYQSRKAHFEDERCECSRFFTSEGLCSICEDAHQLMECAENGSLSAELEEILKPVVCEVCMERFADKLMLEKHVNYSHERGISSTASVAQTMTMTEVIPQNLSVSELKAELTQRKKSTSGTKAILIKRLESALRLEL